MRSHGTARYEPSCRWFAALTHEPRWLDGNSKSRLILQIGQYRPVIRLPRVVLGSKFRWLLRRNSCVRAAPKSKRRLLAHVLVSYVNLADLTHG
jgi:hypothetical protein